MYSQALTTASGPADTSEAATRFQARIDAETRIEPNDAMPEAYRRALIRPGDGTEESHRRARNAVDAL